MKSPIYVIGHKNPDTDSIVSAIAYAEYKRQLGFDTVAARLGSTPRESEYLLEKFGFEEPIKIYSGKQTLKEIEMDKAIVASKDLTMKEALDKVLKLKNRGLVIVDEKKHLESIVTLGDLTYMWTKTDKELEKIIKTITLKEIVKTLNGKVVVGEDVKLSGKMHMFPSLKSDVQMDSIVLLRNEDDKLKYCLNKGAKLNIVVTSSPISKTMINLAIKKKATIVVTELSPLSVTRLIYQTPTIEQIMVKKENIDSFNINDTVEEVSNKIQKTRRRSYPVVDKNGKVMGCISRYHLFNYERKKLILVDHNETKQSIDDIEAAEVLEIVDHHRFGDFTTESPIDITAKVVGATASIIANMYLNNKDVILSPNMAGLLLGAIVSDTICFKSPTTTDFDIEIAHLLEDISGEKAEDLSAGLIANAESLLSKRFIEIVYNDFKEFVIDSNKVGLSQAVCKSKEEFLQLKDNLINYMEDSCISGHYDLLIVMLTRPNGSGSYILSAGSKRNLIYETFDIKEDFVEGLVSRKKQLLPGIINSIGA